jgi:transposase
LAWALTGSNQNDITQLLPLLERVPAVAGRPGRPRQRPQIVLGDRGYDSNRHRQILRARGIKPLIASRRHGHGSGLGRHRWVVERTFSWLHQMNRLLVRYDRRADTHQAFLALGCCPICFRRLNHAL